MIRLPTYDALARPTSSAPARPAAPVDWRRLTLGLLVVFALFQWAGGALGSDRGQAGLVVGGLVVLATLGVERVLFGQSPASAARQLGLGHPTVGGLLAAMGLSLALLLVIPAFLAVTGAPSEFYPGWGWLLPGLFAQAGIAEEVLFRGYLFRHLRRGRPFGRAAVLATGPFLAVHLLLFLTLPWPIALAALLLAAVLSFPLAYLFELGGNTIWAPALLHFVAQGAIKVVVVPGESGPLMAFIWMAASAVLPFLVFLIPRDQAHRG
jgi:membrane protease YdiL (CAAX protease family)